MKKIVFGLIISLSFLPRAKAFEYVYQQNATYTTPGANEITVEDTDIANLPVGEFSNLSSKAIVELYLDFDNSAVLANDVNLNFAVNITVTNFDNVEQVYSFPAVNLFYELKQNSSSGQDRDQDRAAMVVEGGKKVEVSISSANVVPNNLVQINARLVIDRGINLERTAVPTVQANGTNIATTGELLITWDQVVGAEFYDLEWGFVNDYNVDENGMATDLSVDKIYFPYRFFELSSTRISLKNEQDKTQYSYGIPMIFEKGYVVYRVRAVGKSSQDGYNNYFPADWTMTPGGKEAKKLAAVINENLSSNFLYKYEGHDQTFNWQVATSFAEDGKRKTVISYFDGSLRNRQSVTKINTDNMTIVGETVYDYQGRPAVQILPAPTNDERIGYYPNFNRNQDAQPQKFSRTDFDEDGLSSGDECKPNGTPLSEDYGTGQYYSENNPDQSGLHAYIPDGDGYVYSQIEYTPDNTGRVRRQGGVGEQLGLGSGHETKYYYSAPAQEDLIRLFGSDVGLAEHYKMNTSVDPNGQVSVSYIDPAGRVIATALTGDADGLEDLEPAIPGVAIDYDLLNKETSEFSYGDQTESKDTDGGDLVYNKQKTLHAEGEYELNYAVDQREIFKFAPCEDAPEETIDVAGYLQLVINFKNECGDEVLDVGEIVMDIEGVDQTTGLVAFSSAYRTAEELKVGEYRISKSLRINKSKLDSLVLTIADQTNCIRKITDFETDHLEVAQNIDCDFTCESCLEELEAIKERNNNAIPPYGSVDYQYFVDQQALCEEICDGEVTLCETGFLMMLEDMKPSGQYGLYLKENPANNILTGGITTTTADYPPETEINGEVTTNIELNNVDPRVHPLSIFNPGNKLPRFKRLNQVNPNGSDRFKPVWDQPVVPFRNEDQTISYVTVVENADGSFTPEIKNGSERPTDIPNEYRVLPQDLLNVKDFIEEYAQHPEWAYSFVYYHPEYPFYEDCLELEAGYKYIVAMKSVTTLDEAKDSEYINVSDGKEDLRFDPILNESNTILDLSQLNRTANWNQSSFNDHVDFKWNNYTVDDDAPISLIEAAEIAANCQGVQVGTACGPQDCSNEKIDSDEEWEIYQKLYYSFQQDIQDEYQTARSKDYGYYNGCIGRKGNYYNPVFSRQINFRVRFGPFNWFSAFRSYVQNYVPRSGLNIPCRYNRHKLYEDKTAAFGLIKETNGLTSAAQTFCVAPNGTTSNNCPLELEVASSQAKARVDARNFNECGLCPLAYDLQELFSSIVRSQSNNLHSDINLGCPDESDKGVIYMTTALKSALGIAIGNGQFEDQLFWDVIEAETELRTNGYYMKFQVKKPGDQVYSEIELLISNSSSETEESERLTIPTEEEMKTLVDNFTYACCLNLLDQPINLTVSNNAGIQNYFTMAFTHESEKVRKFNVEGTILTQETDFKSCTFPDVCTINDTTVAVVNLLNVLILPLSETVDYPLTDAGNQDLDNLYAPLDPNLFSDPETSSFYNLLMPAANWSYVASVNDNTGTLNMTFSDVDGVADPFTINLSTLDGSSFPFQDKNIRLWGAARPAVNSSSDGTFLISAFIENTSGAYERIDFLGTSSLQLIDCENLITVTTGL